MATWIKNSCRLGWFINPEEEKAYIYRMDGSIHIANFDDPLDGEDVLPGFRIELHKLR